MQKILYQTVKAFVVLSLTIIVACSLGFVFVRYVLEIPPVRPVVPSFPPDEAYRFFVEDKTFSMICPSDWFSESFTMIKSYSQTNISSSSFPLGRIMALNLPLKEVDEIRQLPTMTFQNETAYFEIEVMQSRKTFGHGGNAINLFFERNGKWYQLIYAVNCKLKEFPPPIIIDYFSTFRISSVENPTSPHPSPLPEGEGIK